MPKPFEPDEPPGRAPVARNRTMREADPRDLAAAADELRERTMTLEPQETMPAKWLIGAIVAAAACLAVATIVFRSAIRGFFGLA